MKRNAPNQGDRPGKQKRPGASTASAAKPSGGDGKGKGNGLLAGIRPYFRQYPTGKAGLFDSLKLVSDDATHAFKTLKRAYRRSDDRDAVVAAAKAAFPAFRAWLVADLSTGVPDSAAVERLVVAVEGVLAPVLPAPFVAQVVAFIRAALADGTVADILRHVRDMPPFPWEAVPADLDVDMEAVKPRAPSGNGGKGKGMLAGIHPYFKQYPTGKEGLFENLSHVSEETSIAFRKVRRSFRKAENREDIISGVKDTFPVVHAWLKIHIKDDAMPTTEDISMLVAAVAAHMTPVLGEEFVSKVATFLKTALADEAAVAVLRRVRDMGPFAWDEAVSAEKTTTKEPSAEMARKDPSEKKGVFAGIRPYFAKYPSGRSGLFESLKLVSMDTKFGFKKLRRSMNTAENRADMIDAAAAAFPIVRSWTKSDLSDSNMPSAASVDKLISDVEACIQPKVGAEIVERTKTFIRAVLSDDAAVSILRETREMGPFPWDGNMEVEVAASSRSVDVAPGKSGEGKKGLLAGIRPYFAKYPSGRNGLFADIEQVTDDTKTDFQKLKKAVWKAENRDEIRDGARKAVPIVRKWMRSDLGRTGMPSEDGINKLVNALDDCIKATASANVVERLGLFVRSALHDTAAVGILRQVRKMFPLHGKDKQASTGDKGSAAQTSEVQKGPTGFDVHVRTKCSNCDKMPIVGSRFKCMSRKDHNLCGRCYMDDKVDKEGLEFKECKYVWEGWLNDAKAPPAPLKQGERGPRVKFLHKVLTDLGYMDASMYTPGIGMYGSKTRDAVQKFQHDNKLDSVTESGVYDTDTAAGVVAMLESGGRGSPVHRTTVSA